MECGWGWVDQGCLGQGLEHMDTNGVELGRKLARQLLPQRPVALVPCHKHIFANDTLPRHGGLHVVFWQNLSGQWQFRLILRKFSFCVYVF